jgi:hypothetical protein
MRAARRLISLLLLIGLRRDRNRQLNLAITQKPVGFACISLLFAGKFDLSQRDSIGLGLLDRHRLASGCGVRRFRRHQARTQQIRDEADEQHESLHGSYSFIQGHWLG